MAFSNVSNTNFWVVSSSSRLPMAFSEVVDDDDDDEVVRLKLLLLLKLL